MAATTTELMVRLVADTKGFAAELGGATRDMDALQAKATRLGTAMQDVGKRMTLGFTVPFVAGMGFAVKAASDLNESQNKMQVVFGKSAASMEKWAQDSARSFGMSRAAAYEAAGTFGNLFRSMDIGLPSAAKMSKHLVELAADLASFNNANPEEVLLALRSGLVGEVEPLRKFGVSLSAARVEAKALEMGLWDGNGAISAAAKAQAAYQIILEDTTLAQGDFARTADGAANQMRIARAQLTDAAASIGTVVLPMFADFVGVLADLASWFADLPGPIQTVIVVLGGLVAAAGPVLWVTGSIIKNVTTLVDTFPRLGTAASAVGSALGPLAAPALAIGITAVAVAFAKSTHHALDYADAAKQVARASDEAQARLFMQAVAVERLMGGLGSAAAPARLFSEVLQQGVGPAERLIENLKAAGYNTDTFESALRKEIAAQQQVNADSERGASLLNDLGVEASSTATNFDELRTAFDDLHNAQFDVEGSAISMERAIQDLNQSVLDGKDGTLEGRQAYLDAKQSIDDWGRAVYDNAIAAGKSTSDAAAEQTAALAWVAGTLDPGSPLRQWLDQYINDLNRIPSQVQTTLTIAGRTYNLGADGGVTDYNPLGIPGFSQGGWVGGSGSGDTVPAMLAPGEFVLSRDMLAGRAAVPAGVGAASGGPMVAYLVLDGKVAAEAVFSAANRSGGPKLSSKAVV